MSQIPNMLESTIQKIREMVDVNSVIGEPISTPDGVTIIPVSKVSGLWRRRFRLHQEDGGR